MKEASSDRPLPFLDVPFPLSRVCHPEEGWPPSAPPEPIHRAPVGQTKTDP